MKDPKKKAVKALKRRRKVAAKKKIQRQMIASGKIIMFGRKMIVLMHKSTAPKVKKPKVVKPLAPYLAVKLTTKYDKLVAQIRYMDPNDPKLASLKSKRDIIKKRLNQK